MKNIFVLFLLMRLLFANGPIQPIPLEVSYNKAKAQLGKMLFFDPSLSKDGTISCASCHDISNGGDDGRRISVGIFGRKGEVNAPTVLNARFNFRQFCNGRAKDLYEQAAGPLFNPVEMGMTPQLLQKRISSNTTYKKLFKTIYRTDSITLTMIIDAIVEYEKTLITPNSKFDRFLRGESALSKKEMQGYRLFKELGCISCHNGINIGGNSMQKMGIIHPYPNTAGDLATFTGKKEDRGIYKVPTLRNIALTAPYMHDGTIATLKEVIDAMAYYNLGFHLQKDEIEAIEAFLHTLTGTLKDLP